MYNNHNTVGYMPSSNSKTTIMISYTLVCLYTIDITIFEKNMQSGHCNGILFDTVYHYIMMIMDIKI